MDKNALRVQQAILCSIFRLCSVGSALIMSMWIIFIRDVCILEHQAQYLIVILKQDSLSHQKDTKKIQVTELVLLKSLISMDNNV